MAKLDDITNNEFRHDSRLKGFLRNTFLFGSMAIGSIFASQETIAQYNVNIHARSLDKTANGTPISGMVISKDGGDVVEVTNASGDATMSNVGGSMSIKISHPDYMQFTQNFNITKDTTIYLATPAKIRTGTWGTATTDANYFTYMYNYITGDKNISYFAKYPVDTKIISENITLEQPSLKHLCKKKPA